MKYSAIILLLLSVCLSCQTTSKTFKATEISVVPKPSDMVIAEGSYSFSKSTKIFVDNESQKPAAKYLSDLFEKAAGYPISI